MPRIAWFSPLPPVRSGIAAYTAEVLERLDGRSDIDVYDESTAHDFVWRHANQPYDLTVYQLGNSLSHAYQWAYLTRYPGLTVLHDAQLHQARALDLLQHHREDDYRAELRFSHPDAADGVADLVSAGLGGSLFYLWPMLRLVVESSRAVAVHNSTLAGDLRRQFPDASISTLHMGVRAPDARVSAAAVRTRHGIPDGALVFGAYGAVTPAKRIEPMLRALARVARSQPAVHALIAGNPAGGVDVPRLTRDLGLGGHVTLAGYVADEDLGDYLHAADVCVCLRWPSTGETSASWVRCLGAGKPTIITNLVQTADLPYIDARTFGKTIDPCDRIGVAVDVLDEDRTLEIAMARLAADAGLRAALGANARAYWSKHHTVDQMARDYAEVMGIAMRRKAPRIPDVLAYLRGDASDLAKRLASGMGVNVDVLS